MTPSAAGSNAIGWPERKQEDTEREVSHRTKQEAEEEKKRKDGEGVKNRPVVTTHHAKLEPGFLSETR